MLVSQPLGHALWIKCPQRVLPKGVLELKSSKIPNLPKGKKKDKKHYVGQLKISKITPGTFFVQILNPGLRFFMVAGGACNSACQLSKEGFCLSRLPSTQKKWVIPTKLGGFEWVCTARYRIFLVRIGILLPKWPLYGLQKHHIIAWKNY